MTALTTVHVLETNDHLYKVFSREGFDVLIKTGVLCEVGQEFKPIDYPMLAVIVDKKLVSHSPITAVTQLINSPLRVHVDATDEEIIETAKSMRVTLTESVCSDCDDPWDPDGEIVHRCGSCGVLESRKEIPRSADALTKDIDSKLALYARAAKLKW